VYDSYGNVIEQSNPAASTRYSYTGRELDAETGLHYYRARYYDAATGRFLSEDPLGLRPEEVNLYRYVGNQPLIARDPLGLDGWSESINAAWLMANQNWLNDHMKKLEDLNKKLNEEKDPCKKKDLQKDIDKEKQEIEKLAKEINKLHQLAYPNEKWDLVDKDGKPLKHDTPNVVDGLNGLNDLSNKKQF
jgi:RHS repeat-associated protein